MYIYISIVLPLLISLTKPSFPFLSSSVDSLLKFYFFPVATLTLAATDDRKCQSVFANSVHSDKCSMHFLVKNFVKPKIHDL